MGEEEKVISPQGMAHSRHPEALGSQYIIFMAIVAQIYTLTMLYAGWMSCQRGDGDKEKGIK